MSLNIQRPFLGGSGQPSGDPPPSPSAGPGGLPRPPLSAAPMAAAPSGYPPPMPGPPLAAPVPGYPPQQAAAAPRPAGPAAVPAQPPPVAAPLPKRFRYNPRLFWPTRIVGYGLPLLALIYLLTRLSDLAKAVPNAVQQHWLVDFQTPLIAAFASLFLA